MSIYKNNILSSNLNNINTFSPQDWLPNDYNFTKQEIAYYCLSHLIKSNSLSKWLNILEVWPIPTSNISVDKAPISLFKNKLPQNNYLWIGWHHNNDKNLIKKVMFAVDFISWVITSEYTGAGIDQVVQYFNWKVDIVYWRHVYENSFAEEWTFFSGRNNMLEWTVKLLKDWWYIIIDNASWSKGQVLIWNWIYSKHLKLVWEYYYSKEKWIYIYQKPLWIDQIAEKEQNIKEQQSLLLELNRKKEEIIKLLWVYSEEERAKNQTIIKIQKQIKKHSKQVDKMPNNISNKNDIIRNLEEHNHKFLVKIEKLMERIWMIVDLKQKAKAKLLDINVLILDTWKQVEELLNNR